MKKVLMYSFFTILTIVIVGVAVMVGSVRHVQLPHGAVLHVLPGLTNSQERSAVVIGPGGGYSYLEKWREGYWWFPYFYIQGYVPAMLEYRMPRHHSKSPMTDAAEAIKTMKKNAKEWHFNANDVGIMGFSAGGHLASTMMVIDNDAVRPDFGILFYPVISMKKELTHMGSHNQLLGEDATAHLEYQFSSEQHVSQKTPPAFIAVASDDMTVTYQNSVLFGNAMRAKGLPVELHIYPSGGHGFVCRPRSEYRRQVLGDLADWLGKRKETIRK